MTDRDTRRKAVLLRMADHLLATGLRGASLRPLAAAAGTSDRMLLYYFADKDELLAATLAEVAGRMLPLLEAAIDPVPRSSGPLLAATYRSTSCARVTAASNTSSLANAGYGCDDATWVARYSFPADVSDLSCPGPSPSDFRQQLTASCATCLAHYTPSSPSPRPVASPSSGPAASGSPGPAASSSAAPTPNGERRTVCDAASHRQPPRPHPSPRARLPSQATSRS